MKIALVDDEQEYLDKMAELIRNFGAQPSVGNRPLLKRGGFPCGV